MEFLLVVWKTMNVPTYKVMRTPNMAPHSIWSFLSCKEIPIQTLIKVKNRH